MAFQSLYRRYRPRRFGEVRGQDHVVLALRNAVRDGTVAHAYLLSGPRGTGKTSTARILAKALNCESPADGEPCCVCASCVAVEAGTSLDVQELDAASHRGVDDMRDLVARVALGTGGRTKLYILDEVHMLTKDASNTLLKTLEEPPGHVVFALATTEPEKVLPTIRSRTQHFAFRLLPATTLEEHLHWVADDAGLDVPDEALRLAVRRGQGSARDALSALDQLVAAGGQADEDTSIDEVAEALCERDTGRALVAVAGACAAGRDPRHLAEAVLAHLRDAFLAVLAPGVVSLPDEAFERVVDQGRRLGPAATVRALDILGEALLAMREAPDPRVALEVALVRVTRPEADASPAAIVERLERLERAARAAPIEAGGPERPGQGPSPAPAPAAAPARADARRALGAVQRADAGAPPPAPARPTSAPPAAPSEPTQEPAQAATPEPAAGPLPTRDELTVLWADHVLGSLKARPRALFSGGRFVSSDEQGVVFAVPAPLVAKATEVRADVEAALAARLGRPVVLRLVADEPLVAPTGPATSDDLAEAVDLTGLRDAPPDRRDDVELVTRAFPGAEVVEEPGAGG